MTVSSCSRHVRWAMVFFAGPGLRKFASMNSLLRICAISMAGTFLVLGQGTPSTGLDPEIIQVFRSLDRDRNGELSPVEYLAGDLAGIAVRRGGREHAGVVFGHIDKDGNRALSLLEFSSSQNTRNLRILGESRFARFHGLDMDGNGFISKEEFESGRMAGGEIPFEEVDQNGSGVIGPLEFSRFETEEGAQNIPAREFVKLDKNDNGTIDETEFASFFPDKDKTERAEVFLRIDLNGNGEINAREYSRFKQTLDMQGIDERTREMFEDLDRNRDGTLSLREFSRSRLAERVNDRDFVKSAFSRIDRDGSGDVNLKEFATRMEVVRRGGKMR